MSDFERVCVPQYITDIWQACFDYDLHLQCEIVQTWQNNYNNFSTSIERHNWDWAPTREKEDTLSQTQDWTQTRLKLPCKLLTIWDKYWTHFKIYRLKNQLYILHLTYIYQHLPTLTITE